MIIVTWRFSVLHGNVTKGLEWAKHTLATMTKSGLAPSKWRILRPRSGDTDRFLIVGEFASMAEFEAHIAKRDADPGFQAHAKERLEAGWTAGVVIVFNEVFEES